MNVKYLITVFIASFILFSFSSVLFNDSDILKASSPSTPWKTNVTVTTESYTHASTICSAPNGSLFIVYKTGASGDFGSSYLKIIWSYDGGFTWGNDSILVNDLTYVEGGSATATYLDPALFREGDRIYFTFCGKPTSASDYSDPSWVYLWWSDDNGSSWSGEDDGSPEYVNFTSIYPDWSSNEPCGLTNPAAFQTLNGSWVIPTWFGANDPDFSDCHGDCFISYPGSDMTSINGWKLLSSETSGESIGEEDNVPVLEPTIAYLTNHTWLCIYRAASTGSVSPDQCWGTGNGTSWGGYSAWKWSNREDSRYKLLTYSSNLTYDKWSGTHEIYHDKERLLFAWTNSTSRDSTDIAISYDDGATWEYEKNLDGSYGAYSDMTVTDNGTIVVEYSESISHIIRVALFNLEWLTDSNDWLDEGESGSSISFSSINGVDNNSQVIVGNRTFIWNKITNATKYQLQVSNSSGFGTTFIDLDNISEGSGLESMPGGDYSENASHVTFLIPYAYNISFYGSHYYRVRAYTS